MPRGVSKYKLYWLALKERADYLYGYEGNRPKANFIIQNMEEAIRKVDEKDKRKRTVRDIARKR